MKLLLVSVYLLGICRIYMVISADVRSRAKTIEKKSEVDTALGGTVAEGPVIRPPRSSLTIAQPEKFAAVSGP